MPQGAGKYPRHPRNRMNSLFRPQLPVKEIEGDFLRLRLEKFRRAMSTILDHVKINAILKPCTANIVRLCGVLANRH